MPLYFKGLHTYSPGAMDSSVTEDVFERNAHWLIVDILRPLSRERHVRAREH